MEDVAIVTMSEFGRTVEKNGTGGTDYGRGSLMMVLGGPVQSGKIYGEWPGLEKEQLFEGCDLGVTTDFRAVLSELVHHLGRLRRSRPIRVTGFGKVTPPGGVRSASRLRRTGVGLPRTTMPEGRWAPDNPKKTKKIDAFAGTTAERRFPGAIELGHRAKLHPQTLVDLPVLIRASLTIGDDTTTWMFPGRRLEILSRSRRFSVCAIFQPCVPDPGCFLRRCSR